MGDDIDQDCSGEDKTWAEAHEEISDTTLPNWDSTVTVVDSEGLDVLTGYVYLEPAEEEDAEDDVAAVALALGGMITREPLHGNAHHGLRFPVSGDRSLEGGDDGVCPLSVVQGPTRDVLREVIDERQQENLLTGSPARIAEAAARSA